MQIIRGRGARKTLHTPSGKRTRPTSARVREALFSILESRIGSFEGLNVLDGFAGSGALGLEAWSRGAQRVVLIESHRPTCRVIQQNIAALRAQDDCSVVCARLPGALSRAFESSRVFDVVFLDAPYGATSLQETLSELARDATCGHGLDARSWVMVEHATTEAIDVPAPFDVEVERAYGSTSLTLFTLGDHSG